MKGLICGIYESKRIGNCSNNGISSKCRTVTLIGKNIPEIFEPTEDSPAVTIQYICTGTAGKYIYAVPLQEINPGLLDWMAGGCFIYTSDSRFPSRYPIALHDRQESQESYDRLSI